MPTDSGNSTPTPRRARSCSRHSRWTTIGIVVDVTPNRPDLLGHKGIARELAASLNVPYRLPQLGAVGALAPDVPPVQRAAGVRETVTGPLRVAIDDPEGCARFHAAVVRGVKVGPSPAWLRQPLEAVGVRSINNIVDATNYVMLELGQPMHAYDLATLKGPALVARRGARGREAGDAGRRRAHPRCARPR